MNQKDLISPAIELCFGFSYPTLGGRVAFWHVNNYVWLLFKLTFTPEQGLHIGDLERPLESRGFNKLVCPYAHSNWLILLVIRDVRDFAVYQFQVEGTVKLKH